MAKITIAKYIRLSLEDAKYDSLSITNQHLLLDRHIDTLELVAVVVAYVCGLNRPYFALNQSPHAIRA